MSTLQQKNQKNYTAPSIEVIELAVECGFNGSIGDLNTIPDDPIENLDKWNGWED